MYPQFENSTTRIAIVVVVARVIHSIGMGSLYGSSSLHCIAGPELHTGAKLFSGSIKIVATERVLRFKVYFTFMNEKVWARCKIITRESALGRKFIRDLNSTDFILHYFLCLCDNLYNNLSISVSPYVRTLFLQHLWSDLKFKGTYGILGSRRT